MIDERIVQLGEWLQENAGYCAEEQAHLTEGSRERAYWHHGYLAALRDLRVALERSPRK